MKKLLTVLLVMFALGCGTAKKVGNKLGSESQKMGDEAVEEGKKEAAEAVKVDVVATALANGNFSTFIAAVEAAELTDTLRGTGPFTVFAPTDQAFADLPEGVIDNLMKPESKEELRKLLMFHVIAGKIMAADASTMDAPTLATETAAVVKGEDGSLTYAGATVSTTDIDCTNGVIHVVDKVVMPGGPKAVPAEETK